MTTASSMPQESPLTMQNNLPFASVYAQPHNDGPRIRRHMSEPLTANHTTQLQKTAISVSRRARGCRKRKIETQKNRDRYRQIGTDRDIGIILLALIGALASQDCNILAPLHRPQLLSSYGLCLDIIIIIHTIALVSLVHVLMLIACVCTCMRVTYICIFIDTLKLTYVCT